MDLFIDKESIHKLKILKYLDNREQKTADITELITAIDSSYYLTTKAIESLIVDVKTLGISDVSIQLANNKVTLTYNEAIKIQLVRLHYLEQSPHFHLLDSVFKHSANTLKSFASKNFISLSRTYVIKKELEIFFEPYNVKISANYSFSGKETQIRMMLFYFYFSKFNSTKFPFSLSIESIAENFTNMISKGLSHEITETQYLKLKYMSAVIFQRYRTKDYIHFEEKYMFTLTKKKSLSNYIQLFFEEYTSVPTEFLFNETLFFQSFLLAEEFIFIKKEEIYYKDSSIPLSINNLNTFFCVEISKYLDEDALMKSMAVVKQGLSKIHWKFLYFEPIDNFFIIDDDFILKNYPSFYHVVSSIVHSLYENYPNFDSHCKKYLVYEYTFLLIQTIPDYYKLPTINVCVDFSSGDIYNQFIGETIRSFQALNIRIEKKVSKKTDFYLSDLYIPNLECPHLIWTTAPTASDWEILNKELTSLGHLNKQN